MGNAVVAHPVCFYNLDIVRYAFSNGHQGYSQESYLYIAAQYCSTSMALTPIYQ